MSETIIQLIYHGAAVDKGTMNGGDLALALLAFDDLCHQANRVLNDNVAEVHVFVQSDFKRGSFGIDFKVVLDFVSIHQKALFDAGASILVALIINLIKFRKRLEGKEPRTVTAQPNGQVIINNNVNFEVPKEVLDLHIDLKVRQAVEKLVKPLKGPGYNALEIKSNDDPVLIKKEELGFFQVGIDTPKTTAVPASVQKAESGEEKLTRLERENAALKAEIKARPMGGVFRMKISEKGGLSVYGLGRFPLTLYQEQWKRLLEHKDEILQAIVDNADQLSSKPLGK